MTAPQDPFRSPEQGGPGPSGTPDPGRPAAGSGPSYGAPAYGAPAYGAPAYGGGPAYGGAPPRGASNGLGTAALVLGVLAVLTGFFLIGGLLGIVAVVLGVLGRRKAKRGEATNGGMALAGIVLGVIGVLLAVVAIATTLALFDSGQVRDLNECLQDAGGDAAAEQACRQQLEDELGS